MAAQYQIQIFASPRKAWEAYQSLNATNDRAAQSCYAKWLKDITPSARVNFRLIKMFANPEII